MRYTGAQILIECLLEQGVDTVFGYPGGAVLNIYDALYQYSDKIRHILTAHEQGAAHAADGYARSTGKVGVVIATSGPGATNLVTGIATAYMDSVPMVAITGNVPLALLGRDSFQEVDITGITIPITKHNYIVKNIDDLADIVREAFKIARSGRPGPVLIDIPKDMTSNETRYEKKEIKIQPELSNINEKAIDTAVELIASSKKPLIYVGGGVIASGASEELQIFAEKTHTPVASSIMGLGGFPANHSLFTGLIGMHGTAVSSLAANECDLIIAIGARFSDRVASNRFMFAPKAKVIHIDIDPAEINKNVRAHHSIIGNVKCVLSKLNQKVPNLEHKAWENQINEWQKEYHKPYKCDEELKPQYVIETLRNITNEDAAIVTDVGQHQMWTAQYFKFIKPRTFISSGGLGTMGFGMGAAIGTKIANPEKQVFLISGDGSFHMNCNELTTAVTYNIPIKIIVMNNSVLGMVRQWQKVFYNNRFSQTTLDRKTDLVKLAEAYGAHGLRLTETKDVSSVLEKALSIDGPVVIDCQISRDENVLPMIPPGATVNEIITEI